MSVRIRRRTLSIALLAAALPAPARAASGWLQSPLLSVGGDLRGVGFGRGAGGGPQVIYGETPGFGEDGAPTFERSVRRIPDGPWRAPEPSGLPAGLREVSINAAGNAVGWRRGLDPESSLVVSSFGTASRHDPGGWSAPRTLATRTRAAQVVLMDDGEALAAWSTQDGAVFAALRGRFGDWRPATRLEVPGSTPSGPIVGVNEAGDAVVVWARGPAGRARIRAAARPASLVHAPLPFARTLTLPGPIGRAAPSSAALDLEGDAVVAWSLGSGRTLISDHRSGASRWSPARRLASVPGAVVGAAAGGGAVAAGSAGAGGRISVAVRSASGGPWRSVPGPPASACCLVGLLVTRTGDAVIAGTNSAFDDLLVFRRAAGSRSWARAPLRIDPGYRQQVTRMASNAAGDLVVAWNWNPSNTSKPLYAAAYQAVAPPVLSGALRPDPVALRPGGTMSLRFPLTRPGRVLVTLRRPFGGRALAAFTVAGRRGANTVRVPRAALARLRGPGRYIVTAETGSRRPGGVRTAEVRLLPG
jgi:hypothetical protein